MKSRNVLIRGKGRYLLLVSVVCLVGFFAVSCASAPKGSSVPLDRSLASLKMLDPIPEEEAGVPFSILEANPVCDIRFSFPGMESTFIHEYKGENKKGGQYSGQFMCYGGTIPNLAMWYAKKANIPEVKKIPATMALVNATVNDKIVEACPDRTIKIGDTWSTNYKQMKKMDVITGNALMFLSSQDFEVMGFAEVQGARCAILKVSMRSLSCTFYSANLKVGSTANASNASGYYAWDYKNKKLVATLLDGRVNAYRDGAIANPVKFLQTEKFASTAKDLDSVSEIALVTSTFNPSLGYSVLAFVALSTVNNKILPAFESLPPQYYAAMVESALDSSLYPIQALPAITYSMTYTAK